MEDFKTYLLEKRVTTAKQADFYVHWVESFYRHFGKSPDELMDGSEIEAFLKHVSQRKEAWQVDQAKEAIGIYGYWKARRSQKGGGAQSGRGLWQQCAEHMKTMMRLRHLSLKTEKTYMGWVRRFYRFVEGKHPDALTSDDVKNYMTFQAVEKGISVSTQNQAFCALLFLYRHVLDKPIEDIRDAVRARRKRRVPTVLTQAEVSRMLEEMQGVHRLMAELTYGGGLRLTECLRLRVKDLDFERLTVVIRDGKGGQDRETVMPKSSVPILKTHLNMTKKLYDKDRNHGIDGVEIPGALARKLPSAGREWNWFWVFPSHHLSEDPRTGTIRRHHMHESVLQRHVRQAAFAAKITKRVTVHTLRHSFATHLVEKNVDIRTVQELLGHKQLETTMIYTHVAKTNRLGIKSPLD